MSQLGATAEVGFVGSCLGRRFFFSPFPKSYSAGLEAKVREVGSLKPWTANVKVLKTNNDAKGFTSFGYLLHPVSHSSNNSLLFILPL